MNCWDFVAAQDGEGVVQYYMDRLKGLPAPANGDGLSGVRERLESIGGKVLVESKGSPKL